jgi:hypothetical protein
MREMCTMMTVHKRRRKEGSKEGREEREKEREKRREDISTMMVCVKETEELAKRALFILFTFCH